MSTFYIKCSNCQREIGSAEPMKVLRRTIGWNDTSPDGDAYEGISEAVCKDCAELAGLKCDK